MLRRNRIISVRQVSLPVQKLRFSLINNYRAGVDVGGHGGHTVVAHEGQQRVRGRVRVAEKAPEGMTDRQTIPSII